MKLSINEGTGSDKLEYVDASNFQHLEVGNDYKVKTGSETIKCKFINWVDKNGDIADPDIEDPELIDLRFADLDDGMEWEAYYHNGGYRAGSSASKLYVKELPTVKVETKKRSTVKLTIKQLKNLIKEAIFDNESFETISKSDMEQFITRIFNEPTTVKNIIEFFTSRGLDDREASDFAMAILSLKILMLEAINPNKVKKDNKEDWEFYMGRVRPLFDKMGLDPKALGIIFPIEEWLTTLEKSKGDFITYDDDDDYEYYRGGR